MDMIIAAIVIGIVAGITHQLMDRVKPNNWTALLRGAIVGGVASLLTLWVIPEGVDKNTMYITLFTAGYVGDNVILNIIDRKNKYQIVNEVESVVEKEIDEHEKTDNDSTEK